LAREDMLEFERNDLESWCNAVNLCLDSGKVASWELPFFLHWTLPARKCPRGDGEIGPLGTVRGQCPDVKGLVPLALPALRPLDPHHQDARGSWMQPGRGSWCPCTWQCCRGEHGLC
jgi:hypothetical protein